MPEAQAVQQVATDGGMVAEVIKPGQKPAKAKLLTGATWIPQTHDPVGGKIPFIGAPVWVLVSD